jgi:hypothetical protein
MPKPIDTFVLKAAIQWAYKMIGIKESEWEIVEKLEDLIYEGKEHFALYSHAAIKVWYAMDPSNVYHESFHRVSLGYLGPIEHARLLRAARARYKMPKEEFTDKQVEEKLADEFQEFMKVHYSTLGPKYTAIERFFIKLKNFIYRLFIGKNKLDDYDIDLLFTHIGRGLYANSKVRDMHNIKPGEYQKTIVGATVVESLESRKAYRDTIGMLTNLLLQVSGVKDIENIRSLNFNSLANTIKNKYIPEAEYYSKDPNATPEQRLRDENALRLFKEILGKRYKLKLSRFEKGFTGFSNLDNIWIPEINDYLYELGVVRAEDIADMRDIENPNDDTEFNRTAGNLTTGGAKTGVPYGKVSYEFRRSDSIRSNIKYLIRRLHEWEYDPNTKGFRMLKNEWGGSVFVSFSKTWHEIINLVYPYESVAEMINALEMYANLTKNGTFKELADILKNPRTREQTTIQFFHATKAAKRNFIAAEVSQNRGNHDLAATVIIDEVAQRIATRRLLNRWTDGVFTDTKLYNKTLHDGFPGFLKEGDGCFVDIYKRYQEEVIKPFDVLIKRTRENRKQEISTLVSEKELNEIIDSLVNILNSYHIDVDRASIEYYLNNIDLGQGQESDNPIERKYFQIYFATSDSHFGSMIKGYRDAAIRNKVISKKDWRASKFSSIRLLATAHLLAHPELVDDSILGPNNNMYYEFSATCHTTDTFTKLATSDEWLNSLAGAAGYAHSRLLRHLMVDPNAQDQVKERARAEQARKAVILRTFSHLRVMDDDVNDRGRGFFATSSAEDFLFDYTGYVRESREGGRAAVMATPMASREGAFYVEGMPIFEDPITRVFVNEKGEADFEFSHEVEQYFYGVYLDEVDKINNGWQLIKRYLEADENGRKIILPELVENKHYVPKYVKDADGKEVLQLDFKSANTLKFHHLAGLEGLENATIPALINGEWDLKDEDVIMDTMSFADFQERIHKHLQDIILSTVDFAKDLDLLMYGEDYQTAVSSRTSEVFNAALPDFHILEQGSVVSSREERKDLHLLASIGGFAINKIMALVESEKVLGMNPEMFKFNKHDQSTFADLYKRWAGPGSSGDRFVSSTRKNPSTTYGVSIFRTQHYASQVFYNINVERHAEKIARRMASQHNSREASLRKSLSKIPKNPTEQYEENRKTNQAELEAILKKKDVNNKGNKTFQSADFIEEATKMAKLNLAGFLNVDSTDGGSWISVEMFKELLERSGDLSPELNDLIDRVESGTADVTEMTAFMPQKTMYLGISVENGAVVLTYDKMAMGVLFKSLAKDTPMEDLYNRMNAIGKYEGLRKIGQVLMDSAVKSGGRIGFEFFKDANEMTETNDLTDMPIWDREWSNLRKQQNVEVSEDNTGQAIGTAVSKVAPSNIVAEGVYVMKDGTGAKTEVKGSTLRRMVHASREVISNIGADQMRARYGISGATMDVARFVAEVRANAIAAGKPRDFINGLVYDPQTKRMKVALDATTDKNFIYNNTFKKIQKNVVDLVTPGAHLVQLSNWGLTKKKGSGLLKMQMPDEKTGGLMRMECRVSTKLFRHLIKDYDSKTHEQRVAELKEINPTILGYRTPTQGQNSVMSLQIVDFLPHEAADTIFLPLEFTHLTGSDYNINKLFVAFKEYEFKDNKATEVEFITGHNQEDVDRRYRLKVAEYWDIYKSTRGLIPDNVLEEIKNLRETVDFEISDTDIRDFMGSPEDKAALNALYVRYKYYELARNQRKTNIDVTEEGEEAHRAVKEAIIEILNPLDTVDLTEVEFEKKRDALVNAGLLPDITTFARLTLEEQNTKKANVNHLLSIFDTILLSEHHELSTTRPLDSNKKPLEDFANRVQSAENRGKPVEVTPFMTLTQMYQSRVKANNVASARLVGPFALANAFHFITQSANMRMRTHFKYFKNQTNNMVDLGRVIGEDGIAITDWFSAMISATVDLLKSDYIIHLNVNNATVGVVELLIKLGFGKQTFHYMTQPVLKQFTEIYYNNLSKIALSTDENGDPVYDRQTAEDILDDLIEGCAAKAGIELDGEDGINRDKFHNFIKTMEYYSDEEKALADINPDKSQWTEEQIQEFYRRQMSIANQMKWLLQDADALTELTLMARVDTGKIGRTPSQMAFYEFKLRKFLEKRINIDSKNMPKFTNIGKVLYTGRRNPNNVTEEDTCLPILFENSFNLSKELLRHVSVQSTDGFRNMFTAFVQQLPLYRKKYISLGAIHNVEEAMFAWFVGRYFGLNDGKKTSLGITSEIVKEWFVGLDEEIVYNDDGTFQVDNRGNVVRRKPASSETTIFEDLKEIQHKYFEKYPELKQNYFLSLFVDDVRVNSPLKEYLRVYDRNTSDSREMDDYRLAFDELILHEDPFIQQFGAKMKLYAFYSSGNRHRLLSSSKFMSTLSAIKVPIMVKGKRKYIKFTDYFYDLINQLNAIPDKNGTVVSPMELFMDAMVNEVLDNNWWDRSLVRRIYPNPDIMKDFTVDGQVVGIAITPEFANKYLYYGTSKSDLPLYERSITIPGHVPYEHWDPFGDNTVRDGHFDNSSGVLNTLGYYKFIGIDAMTKMPIYVPANKRSYNFRGQEISELGVNRDVANDKSAIRGNNLAKQMSTSERIALINQVIQDSLEEGEKSHLIVYKPIDYAVEKWSTKNYDDSTPSTSRKGYKH